MPTHHCMHNLRMECRQQSSSSQRATIKPMSSFNLRDPAKAMNALGLEDEDGPKN